MHIIQDQHANEDKRRDDDAEKNLGPDGPTSPDRDGSRVIRPVV